MENSTLRKKVVLTCAQPTGKLHLGNYIGAVKQWVEMQNDYECFFGVVDMHAITIPYIPADLRKNSYQCLAQYLACGLDPEKSNLFLQSGVVGHAELAWILSCLCPLGALERMTQFKDKSSKNISTINSGLLYYPVLMAADILIYNADIVPVGEDQKQHIELTRDLAIKFNNFYSDTFVVPEPYIPKSGARIMSLQNPEFKMSKSDKNQNGSLYIIDSSDELRKKIMSAVTDSDSSIKFSEDKLGVSNLMSIVNSITGESFDSIEEKFAGKGYGDFKKYVADVVVSKFEPIRKKYDELINNKDYLDEVFIKGGRAAQFRANKIMSKVYRKSGYLQFNK